MAQDRIKAYIRRQLKAFKFSEMSEEAKIEQMGDDQSCGICIDEFNLVTVGIDEKVIVKVPQCCHFFHEECLVEWVDIKIDKLMKPDCPACRSPFAPSKVDQKKIDARQNVMSEGSVEAVQ